MPSEKQKSQRKVYRHDPSYGEPPEHNRLSRLIALCCLVGVVVAAFLVWTGGHDRSTSRDSSNRISQPTPSASPSSYSQSDLARILKKLQGESHTYDVPAVIALKDGGELEITASSPYWPETQWAVVSITVRNVGELPISGSLTTQIALVVPPGQPVESESFVGVLVADNGDDMSELSLQPGEEVSGRATFGPEGDRSYVVGALQSIAFQSSSEKVVGLWGSDSSPSPRDAWLGNWESDGTSPIEQLTGATTHAHITKEAEHYVAVLQPTSGDTTATTQVLRTTSGAADVLVSESKSWTDDYGVYWTSQLKLTMDGDRSGFFSESILIKDGEKTSADMHYLRAGPSSAAP